MRHIVSIILLACVAATILLRDTVAKEILLTLTLVLCAILILMVAFGWSWDRFMLWWKTRKLSLAERRIRERDAHSESPLELALAKELDRRGISYLREYRISRTRVDFAFPHAKLAVECDGWRYHHDRSNEDAARDAFLKRQGWKVLRFTGDQIRTDVAACAQKIADLL